MKESDIKKILAVIGSVAGLMILIVFVKFLIIDPASENKILEQRIAENEATIQSLRAELSGNGKPSEQLNAQIEQLQKELDKLKEQNKALLESQSSVPDAELKRLNEQIESLQKSVADAEKKLGEANNSVTELQKKLDEIVKSKNTAYTQLLSTFSTQFTYGDAGRVANITVASRTVSGTIVMPGETFSFCGVVGECTVPKGYQEANVFENGAIAKGIGGGVCQVSTTLYNAALLAGMKITERHPHSMKVSYIPQGRDATFSYGYMDLKFVNPYDHPVKIVAEVQNGKLTFSFYSEYKTIKVPTVDIKVSVNGDGDYVMERTLNGTVDYRNTSRYKK